MSIYDLTPLRDEALIRRLSTLVAQDRTTTAQLLAHIAEVDFRRLYAPAGFTSMHAYCVFRLKLSDDAAYKRIQAARQARRYPQIFAAVADGHVHLTGLNLLAPHLAPDNVDELLLAARHRRKSEIEEMLARRFPQVEVLRLDDGVTQLAPAQVPDTQVPAGPIAPPPAPERPKVAPLTAERFRVEFTIDKATHDRLREAQALLSHSLPSGDVGQVFARALEALIPQLEKSKFAATDRPRRARKATGKRTIPAHVKRAVRARDGGRCTYVGFGDHRCEATKFLEFDHVVPVARGGTATVGNLRLRCRTHNRLEAERVFGRAQMDRACAGASSRSVTSERIAEAAGPGKPAALEPGNRPTRESGGSAPTSGPCSPA